HVRNVYRALELPIPEDLFVTNITTQPPAVEIHHPTGLIAPALDGEVTSYFEWIGAGCVEAAAAAAGAMHQVAESAPRVTLVEFGFDLERLYLRVDGARAMREVLDEGVDLAVQFLTPAGRRVLVRHAGGTVTARLLA